MSPTYPRYHLWWRTQKGEGGYHTKHKKSFLIRLDGLQKFKNISKFWFRVEYLKGKVNDSIFYTFDKFKKGQEVARIFTAADEIRFIKKYWNKNG